MRLDFEIFQDVPSGNEEIGKFNGKHVVCGLLEMDDPFGHAKPDENCDRVMDEIRPLFLCIEEDDHRVHDEIAHGEPDAIIREIIDVCRVDRVGRDGRDGRVDRVGRDGRVDRVGRAYRDGRVGRISPVGPVGDAKENARNRVKGRKDALSE
jgi:hypothetical protein